MIRRVVYTFILSLIIISDKAECSERKIILESF